MDKRTGKKIKALRVAKAPADGSPIASAPELIVPNKKQAK